MKVFYFCLSINIFINSDNSLFGMPHALTHMLLHLMQLLQLLKQGQLYQPSRVQKTTKVCTLGPCPYLHTYSHRVFWCVWHKDSRSWSSPKLASGESSAYPFLLQRLSVTVQCGNAGSVVGSLDSEQMEDFLCVTYVYL